LALVEHAGEVIPHKDLVAKVWLNLIVEEISLRVHIACLRKALDRGQSGEHYINNVTGRGCFWAPVSYERFTLDLKPPVLDSKNQRNAALQPSDVALLNRSRKVLREALKSFARSADSVHIVSRNEFRRIAKTFKSRVRRTRVF
jgi:hypothetical protein